MNPMYVCMRVCVCVYGFICMCMYMGVFVCTMHTLCMYNSFIAFHYVIIISLTISFR